MGDSYYPSRHRDSGRAHDRYSPPRREYADTYRTERHNEGAHGANGRDDGYRDNGSFRFHGAAGRMDQEVPRDARADTYRPPRSDFTFQASGPEAPRFPPAPNGQTHSRNGLSRAKEKRPYPSTARGGRGGRGSRGNFRGRWQPRPAHNRAILGFTDNGATEEMFGTHEHAKFDAAMDSSDDDSVDEDDEEDDEQPRKRVKAEKEVEEQAARPQWSNPDPYSVLPPTDVVTTAKKDIVQTIRKRKAEAAATAATVNSIAKNDDYISFNFDDDSSKEASEEGEIDSSEGDDDDFIGAPPTLSAAELPPPPPPPPPPPQPEDDAYIPPPPPDDPTPPSPRDFVMPNDDELMETYAGGAGGKRKRGLEQTVSSLAGRIVDEWISDGSNMTPWVPRDVDYSSSVGLR